MSDCLRRRTCSFSLPLIVHRAAELLSERARLVDRDVFVADFALEDVGAHRICAGLPFAAVVHALPFERVARRVATDNSPIDGLVAVLICLLLHMLSIGNIHGKASPDERVEIA